MSGVTLASQRIPKEIRLKQLPLTLCTKSHATATAYSKVSRGLHFPLEDSGLCTRKNVRRLPVGDSGDLVTPFMQAVNQTARHFATLREL